MKDPRERHIVCKLDRYELEDRYLRLLDEVNSLKKLSNSQEDKIKRLGTKLIRVGGNPHACVNAINVTNDHEKISTLEAENSKLRDKVCILRNQILNQKIFGRSPSRGRKNPTNSSSGATTCRSGSTRLKAASSCNYLNQTGSTNNDIQNYSIKIQEMENEKKTMSERIAELELELVSNISGNRREKVAENVEYIRLSRQYKHAKEKLEAAEEANDILKKNIVHYKTETEQMSETNKKLNTSLEKEKQRVAELSEKILCFSDFEAEIKEKEDQIRDLLTELNIFKEHDENLLELTRKFEEIERENIELRTKMVKQLNDFQDLNIALDTERASNAALEAANDGLLAKISDLQKNVDAMTIQLMDHNEEYRNALALQKSQKNLSSRPSSSRFNSTKAIENYVENEDTLDSARESESQNQGSPAPLGRDRKIIIQKEIAVQTSSAKVELISETTQTDKSLNVAKLEERSSSNQGSPIKNYDQVRRSSLNGGSPLSRERMLKLLEQAQINLPLESQNAAIRLLHGNDSNNNSGPIRASARQLSNYDTLLLSDSGF